MTPSDETPGGPRIAGTIDGDMQPCWLCGRSVAARAFFCHACGAVQPPRPVDPFTRLGVERRFDIDVEQLGRQHAGFARALDPQRFAARGARQQANARGQADALTAAYETLRDPVSRARALLDLHDLDGPDRVENDPGDERDAAVLRAELAAAADAPAVDRVALAVTEHIAACIRELTVAFRAGLPGKASRVLTRLEELEALAAEARARRAEF